MALSIMLGIVFAAGIGAYGFLSQPSFGKRPSGERLKRILNSPNYRDGKFRNQVPTPVMTGDKNRWQALWEFVFGHHEGVRPDRALPTVHTDLKQLPEKRDLMVWFGHSSYLLQIGGKRILVDPVSGAAAPVPFINRPFAGTDILRPEKLPAVDLLIITHDHWDHLDYKTVKALQGKVDKVICPLGVGEHLEYWGYEKTRLVELDWSEATRCDSLVIHCLPARHFSGRGLTSCQSLWASFLIESPSLTLFVGGDGGYGPHFKQIGRSFPRIDWAILENGQYNEAWKFIHTMPHQLEQAALDLNARHIVTVHHSKYALSTHPWDEPLKTAAALNAKGEVKVAIPVIGEVLSLEHDQP